MKRVFIPGITVLLLLAFLIAGYPGIVLGEEPAGLSFDVPTGRESAADHLTDDDDATRFTLRFGETLRIHWQKEDSGKVLLHWFDKSSQIILRYLSADGTVLSEKEYTTVPYRMLLDAPKAASSVEISVKRGFTASLCEVEWYPESDTPPYLEKKEPVDLMLVLSGVTEEVDLLGGLLPLYAGECQIKTAIVYVGKDYGNKVQEAFRAFSAMHVDIIPLFLCHDDHVASSVERLTAIWRPQKIQEELLNIFHQFKPKVIVTCDPKDDFSMLRTSFTAKIVRDLIKQKDEMRRLPVQKIYHLSPDGTTKIDWSLPLPSYNGASAAQIAQKGYGCYGSEAYFGISVPETCQFKLAYTTVGDDEANDDLFEHIERLSGKINQIRTAEEKEPSILLRLDTGIKDYLMQIRRLTDPDNMYYRQPSEPDEVIISDYENGHWEYRSDILSIIINRQILRENNKPYCRYIAHIRMREVNSFRPLTSSNYTKAAATEPPWRLARNWKAILAITGDNINNADADDKGIVIRNGILYLNDNKETSMVMDRNMTMRIIEKNACSGIDLLDEGVLAVYSFGPVLVENHQINPYASQHRVFKENPRCGIGMVAPGHFVAIVTDGRDEKRAYGNTLEDFAQMFIQEGAECAYNLDGGSSAAMVFMGEHINWHSKGTQRGWADCLAWGFSAQVPAITDPLIRQGNRSFY